MDEPTLIVLQAVLWRTGVLLLAGMAGYALVRKFVPGWHWRGKVPVASFGEGVGVLALLLVVFLANGIIFGVGSAEPAKKSVLESGTVVQQMQGWTAQNTMMLSLALAVVGLLKLLTRQLPVDLFGLKRLAWWHVLGTALGMIVPILMIIGSVQVWLAPMLKSGWVDNGPQMIVSMIENAKDPALRLAMILAAAVIAPVTEELMFRGLIYPAIKRFTAGWLAALISSVIFAAIHLHVPSFVPLTVLAMLLAAAYELTGCLWVPMALHSIFNSLMLVALFFGKGEAL